MTDVCTDERRAAARYASVAPHRPPPSNVFNGAFVVIIGPDGVGKTSVARALLARHQGRTAYFHFLPSLHRPLLERPPQYEQSAPDKGPPSGWRILGQIRLARSFIRAWLAHLRCVRPAVSRGALVVADRWAYGYLAQPHALRFYGPSWLALVMLRLLPRPDLVVNLIASPSVIRQRKQELTMTQIERELALWSRVPAPRLRTFVAMDTPEAIAEQVFRELPR